MTTRYTIRIPISATKASGYLDVKTEIISRHRTPKTAAYALQTIHKKDDSAFVRDEHTGRDYYEAIGL